MDKAMLERRLIALESALAHHEAQIRDLSDVIARQWQEIDGLGRRAELTEARLRRLELGADGGGESPAPD